MELWGSDVLDLDGPAQITFDRDRLGSLQFVAVHGWIDYRASDRDGGRTVEFSWAGDDDGDPTSGRGWAALDGEQLVGRLFIHNGDDSAFVATRESRVAGRAKSRARGA
jgi:hypothetical protein